MKRLLVLFIMLLPVTSLLYGQGEIDEQQKVFFRNERAYSVSLNTDGISLGYRQAKRINYLNKNLLEFDLGTLKHPKEYKISSYYTNTKGNFVFGKQYNTIYIRGGIGRQHEIFKKADYGGVAVRYFYTGGLVMALYKPIYYNVIYITSSSTEYVSYDLKEEQFAQSIQSAEDIYNRCNFFKGIDETKFLPGIYAKGGVSFEYSKEDKIIHAIEVGVQANIFPKKIPIMANTDNKAIFLSLFASYKFGLIVDPLHPDDTKLFRKRARKRQAVHNEEE